MNKKPGSIEFYNKPNIFELKSFLVVLISLIFIVFFAGAITFLVAEVQGTTIQPEEVPFEFDPNLIPDGARLIGWHEMKALTLYQVTPEYVDDDGDPCILTAVQLPEGMAVSSFSDLVWTWIPEKTQVGIHFIVFQVEDMPPEDEDSLSDKACYVVKVNRGNNAPRFERFNFNW